MSERSQLQMISKRLLTISLTLLCILITLASLVWVTSTDETIVKIQVSSEEYHDIFDQGVTP